MTRAAETLPDRLQAIVDEAEVAGGRLDGLEPVRLGSVSVAVRHTTARALPASASSTAAATSSPCPFPRSGGEGTR